MNDPAYDQAAETLLGYAGRRASRELLAATIVAPFIFSVMQKDLTQARKEKSIVDQLEAALGYADKLMRLSAANPPEA